MEPALNGMVDATGLGWPSRGRLWLARLRWSLGWAGILGGLLMVTALVMGVLQLAGGASPSSGEASHPKSMHMPPDPRAVPAEGGRVTPADPPWPVASATPLVLDRLARLAVAQGIGWPRADYRYLGATAELPAALEVQCNLKSGYPAIRQFVTAVLREWPSASLRELQLQRAGTEVAEVEARITIVVFLADGSANAGTSAGAER